MSEILQSNLKMQLLKMQGCFPLSATHPASLALARHEKGSPCLPASHGAQKTTRPAAVLQHVHRLAGCRPHEGRDPHV